ncbi:MAG: cytochrome-c peroxidase [Nevskia sp.]|nr:cytochrome-c peroxidase [Nevskia sp.]
MAPVRHAVHRGLALLLVLALLPWTGHAATPAAAAKAPSAAAEAPFYAMNFPRTPSARELTEVGRVMFFDRSLSASGRMACASCHDPRFAYGPPNAAAVQPGGADLKLSGTRAVPSLRYLQSVPPFSEHYYDNDGNDSVDQGPAGGRTWDGRASSAHEQAQLPLFSPLEMANRDAQQVVAKVQAAPYAQQFQATFGEGIFNDPQLAFKGILMALETFQQSPADFYPYSSKYDALLRHQARLTPQELRGLALFNNPAKGNCASCHPSGIHQGAFPAFTDFGYVAVGVPRNAAIPANRDKVYFDLGLCGPARTDLAGHAEYCGLFRVPSLRNVSRRKVFFHNGAFHNLEQVVRFYAQRDTNPGKWYPRRRDGSIDKFNDLPPPYRQNVNMEVPFGGKPGERPLLTEPEIRDIVAFLGTLSDGYVPPPDVDKQSGAAEQP